MSAHPIELQVLAVLRELSPTRQAEILDFALFLREREQRRNGPTDSELSGVQDEDMTDRVGVLEEDPLEEFIGKIHGPPDWADEHDKYIGLAALGLTSTERHDDGTSD